MSVPFISFDEGDRLLDWATFSQALAKGHDLPKASIDDTFLYRDPDTLLSRAAWIDGMGMAVKTATVFPRNPDKNTPMINGAVCLYDDANGTLSALLDFHLVTKWKTAGDSLLGALRLANPHSGDILIVGAGTVGGSLIDAFKAGYPDARISLWNRTQHKADTLAERYDDVVVAGNLEQAVRASDIIVTATMSTSPVVRGAWLSPGQHLNMIGAYRPEMREADDEALLKSDVYVDSFDTTLDHIGELKIPLANGVINRDHVHADFYSLDRFQPFDPNRTTLFKNGGGAHLDLMSSHHILQKWRSAQ
ncbi:MAG: ornithine cyclodeaminase family protein [Paracoccaceae bacterium]